MTSDVCTTGGWVGAVITTPGAIHDGSGGRHSALFTPKAKVIRILLLFHCNRQLSERYNFGSFDLSSEALLCSVLTSFKPNIQHMYSWHNWQTLWRHFCVLS